MFKLMDKKILTILCPSVLFICWPALFLILGGSSAQFRFRDEEDWEETTDTSSTTNRFLVMNLDDLQKSLTCLPLYQRLDIDKDLFSVSTTFIRNKTVQNYLMAGINYVSHFQKQAG